MSELSRLPAWMMNRRAFLARSGAGAGVLAGAAATGVGCSSGSADDDDPDELDPEDWDSVRAQFTLSPDHSHFNAWVVAANPRQVSDAIARVRRELDQEPWKALDEQPVRDTSTRRALAELLGGEPDEVAVTTGTAQGLALVYGGIRLEPGHEILTGEQDGYLTREAVRLAALRTGATAREVHLYDRIAGASVDEIVFRLLGGVSAATRLVALSWVSPDTGLALPVAEIARALADVNDERDEDERVLLCLDGSYALGVEDFDVTRLGCDFFAAGFDHWMFGPRGTGVCWGREGAWQRIDPVLPSFAPAATEAWMAGDDAPEALSGLLASPGGNHDLEHRWAMPAAAHLQRTIGRDRVAEWTLDQATALKAGLEGIDGVTLVTPTDEELSCALVCFRPEDQDPHQMLALLRRRWVTASLAPFDPRLVRLGPSIVTGPADVGKALDAIRDLA